MYWPMAMGHRIGQFKYGIRKSQGRSDPQRNAVEIKGILLADENSETYRICSSSNSGPLEPG